MSLNQKAQLLKILKMLAESLDYEQRHRVFAEIERLGILK